MIRSIYISVFLVLCSCNHSEKKIKSDRTTKNYEAISLLGDTLYSKTPSEKMVDEYTQKKRIFENDSLNIENIIWYGRFTAYTGAYNEAINIYTNAIRNNPNEPRLYRHRGHRYITLRKFDKAIEDLTIAATLVKGKENTVEPDGIPNTRNIPVSTLNGNIYYHLGLAYYLNRNLGPALEAFKNCLETSSNPDNVVSATHWIYMINRRLGRVVAAENYIKGIHPNMDVIENQSYLRACLFYKGILDLKDIESDPSIDLRSDPALQYAIANWWFYNGNAEEAKIYYSRVLEQGDWASFGYIAAENDLAKLY